MSNKYKIEAIVIDPDDQDPLSVDDIKADATIALSEISLEIEGEVKVSKIEG